MNKIQSLDLDMTNSTIISDQLFCSQGSSVNVAAAVVIPLILLLLIGIAILVYIKRRTIQDRLRLPKFARRST
jgi:hypothetical protein